jgi:hypothetical protein
MNEKQFRFMRAFFSDLQVEGYRKNEIGERLQYVGKKRKNHYPLFIKTAGLSQRLLLACMAGTDKRLPERPACYFHQSLPSSLSLQPLPYHRRVAFPALCAPLCT